jgi:hypothetical protein
MADDPAPRVTTKLGAVRPDPRVEAPEPHGGDEVFAPHAVEFSEAFEHLTNQISEAVRYAKEGRDLSAEVAPRLQRLEVRVFGSAPPPLGPPVPAALPVLTAMPSKPPVMKRLATSEASIGMLAQEVANMRGELGGVLAAQSKAMGVAPPDVGPATRARAYLLSRAGVKDLIALVTVVAVVIGLIRGTPPPLPPVGPLSAPSVPR